LYRGNQRFLFVYDLYRKNVWVIDSYLFLGVDHPLATTYDDDVKLGIEKQAGKGIWIYFHRKKGNQMT
jgi:hypothetical protein